MREGLPSAAVATTAIAGVSKKARAEKRGRWELGRNDWNRSIRRNTVVRGGDRAEGSRVGWAVSRG
eukprot:2621955-Pleurochrysis_carterae.AAC.1